MTKGALSPPDLFQAKTVWPKPWLIGSLVQHNEATVDRLAEPAVSCRVGRHGPHLWIICASDAYGADPRNRGAALAAAFTEEVLGKTLTHSPDKKTLIDILGQVRGKLQGAAASRPLGKFAINLTFLVLTGPRLAGANIGENSVIAFTEVDRLTREKSLLPLCVAMQSEKGQNTGLADPAWQQKAGFAHKTISPMHALMVASRHATGFFEGESGSAALFDRAGIENFESQLLGLGPRKIHGYFADYAYQQQQEKKNSALIIAHRTDRPQFKALRDFACPG